MIGICAVGIHTYLSKNASMRVLEIVKESIDTDLPGPLKLVNTLIKSKQKMVGTAIDL